MANDLIPFGKYKGQDVTTVIASDPGYVEWLTAQDWFAQKYRPIYNIMVQAAPQQDLTPEHNAIQARFLDDTFVTLALQTVLPNYEGPPRQERIFDWDADMLSYVDIRFQKFTNREFEAVADVDLKAHYLFTGRRRDGYKLDPEVKTRRFHFELKPTLSDDYPAVIRQIKGQRTKQGRRRNWNTGRDEFYAPYAEDTFVLAYGLYNGAGASESQVKEILRASHIIPLDLRTIRHGRSVDVAVDVASLSAARVAGALELGPLPEASAVTSRGRMDAVDVDSGANPLF